MPKYCIINTDAKTIELQDHPDYRDALKSAGLESGSIDFGSIGHNHELSFSIMVYEFGLMRPKQKTYFRLGRQLFSGNAVIFATNLEGETVNFPTNIAEHWKVCPEFEFLPNADAAEAKIKSGRLDRPQSSVNGQVVWSWNSKETIQ